MSSDESPLRIPRPLWQLKEELAAHIWHRPPAHEILLRTNWALKKEALEEWILLGEQGVPVRKEEPPPRKKKH